MPPEMSQKTKWRTRSGRSYVAIGEDYARYRSWKEAKKVETKEGPRLWCGQGRLVRWRLERVH